MMRNSILLLMILIMISGSFLSCKKKTSEGESVRQTEISDQYKEKAEQEITEENIDEELEKLEEEIESDIGNQT